MSIIIIYIKSTPEETSSFLGLPDSVWLAVRDNSQGSKERRQSHTFTHQNSVGVGRTLRPNRVGRLQFHVLLAALREDLGLSGRRRIRA